jgi:hypothetical protein
LGKWYFLWQDEGRPIKFSKDSKFKAKYNKGTCRDKNFVNVRGHNHYENT